MRNLNLTAQRICVWCGPVMVAGWFLSFTFLGRFIPPPNPENTAAETVAHFSDDTNLIRTGLVLSLFLCALLVPFCAAIAAQMRRAEGVNSVLAETQMLSGTLLCVEFLFPFAIWQTAMYRIDEWDPQLVQMLNDMSWLMFLGIISSACVMVAALGLNILLDKREKPVYPRWAGFYNIWVSIFWVPAAVIVFFKDGPLAWNGIFAWWIPVIVFFTWFTVMTVLTLQAIRDEELEARAIDRAGEGAEVLA